VNKISSVKFWQEIKRARKIRYYCIGAFVVPALIFGIWGFIEGQRDLGTPTYLADVLKAEEYAYIDVDDIPYLFGENDTNKLYFIWDTNDNFYIVDLTKKLYEKLENNPQKDTIRLVGTSKTITNEIKNVAIKVYNRDKSEEMPAMTKDNFNEMLGRQYLNAREDLTNQWVFYGLSFVFLAFVLSFYLAHWFIERKIRRVIDNLPQSEADLITFEVESDKTITFPKNNLFLTENYIISLGNSLDIIKYMDIAWIYHTDIRQNGVLSARRVDIICKDSTHKWIPVMPYGKNRNAHLDIIQIIAEKQPEVLVGYTNDNQKIINETVHKKAKNKS